jgi:hypothetical protein
MPWVVESANFLQFAINNAAHINNMIHSVDGLHVEDSRDMITFRDVLLYLDALDERQNASQKTKYRLATCQLGHKWSLKRNVWREEDGRKVFACKGLQIIFYYGYVLRIRQRLPR